MADLISMLAAAAGAGGDEVDPYFNQTTLLLHGDGTNGAQNNTFLDSSTNNFTITRAGNTTQGSFSPFSKQDGAWGVYFDGNDDGVEAPSSSNFAWALDDFCVEFWVSTLATGVIWDQRPTSTNGNFLLISADSSGFVTMNINSAIRIQGTISIFDGLFHHVCVERNSGTFTLYVDGVADGTSTYGNSMSANQRVRLGHAAFTGAADLNGYISNARAVKNDYVYGGAFTPPTSPLTTTTGYNGLGTTVLLTAQSNRFVDNSASAATLTITGTPKVTPFSPFPITTEYSGNSGSGYFDGTTDYLNFTGYDSDPELLLGTDPFTLEAWVYPTWTTPGTNEPIVAKGSSAAGGTWQLDVQSSSVVNFAWSTSSSISSTGTITPNQWTHIAVVREGTGTNQTKIYINGINDGTGTVSTDLNSATIFKIGRNRGNSTYWDGYISGFRIVRSAVWTANFTPPTAPPTAIANTNVLLNFTNAGIYDNTGFNVLETVGNAQIDTTTKKYGTGSMEFDGTGDWLTGVNGSTAYTLGPIYTVEMWFYTNTVAAGNAGLINLATTSGGNVGFNLYRSSAEIICNDGATGGTGPSSGASTISASTWTHLAIVSDGTNTKLYLDGVEKGTYVGTTGSASVITHITIGAFNDKTAPFNGFIDDLRISRVARYTTTFTPPTKAFPNIGA